MRGAALLAVGLLAALAMGKRRPGTSQSTGGSGGSGTDGGPGGGSQGGGSTTGIPLSLPGTPRGGTFYQVSAIDLSGDDPLERIASKMLYGKVDVRDANVETLADCIADSDWNSYYYGDNAAMAFERQNPSALTAVKNGNWPVLATADGPTMAPSQRANYGTLWLPRTVTSTGNVASRAGAASPAPISCADLNPPKALLDSLGGVTPDWAGPPKGPQA